MTSAIPSASWKAGTMTEVVEVSATRGFYIDGRPLQPVGAALVLSPALLVAMLATAEGSPRANPPGGVR